MPLKSHEERRALLIQAGAETLADELLRLCVRNDDVDASVQRLTSSDKERLKRYKSALAGLRRSTRFVDWRGSSALAARLESILEDLLTSGCDPGTGVDLAARFFECDDSVFGRCDDSSGIIGDMFRVSACDVFVHFASRCEDKDWVLERLTSLFTDDDYGVRDSLLGAGARFLPEDHLRTLADDFWERGQQKTSGSRDSKHWFLNMGLVARALVDPALYEKATVAWCGGTVGGLYRNIAGVYLDANSPAGALRWLESGEPGSLFRHDHDKLLLRAYRQLGATDQQAIVAQRVFDDHYSIDTLDQLIDLVGEDRRDAIIEEAARHIADGELSTGGTGFLLDLGRDEDAERHILEHRSELNGEFYGSLLTLAKRLEEQDLLLPTVCLYRALLESILARAISKYYHHGVRYLKKLDSLAPQLREWGDVEPHIVYRTELLEKHRRKTSFWKKLKAAGG